MYLIQDFVNILQYSYYILMPIFGVSEAAVTDVQWNLEHWTFAKYERFKFVISLSISLQNLKFIKKKYLCNLNIWLDFLFH